MPTINSEVVIGIKVPILRNYTKELLKKYAIQSFVPFFEDLPHQYYEENNIHAFLIEKINNYDECLFQLEQFLPYIDNHPLIFGASVHNETTQNTLLYGIQNIF